jgi:CheY-like chemotaxis protein
VLLVDDDSLVSMNTAYMLMDLGHSVLEAPSAVHALRVLEADSAFDIVITDYAMPGMTGLDLANKIRQIKPKLPVVMATGSCAEQAESRNRVAKKKLALWPRQLWSIEAVSASTQSRGRARMNLLDEGAL